MTAFAITYVSNPLSGILSAVNRWFMIIGYARAASELSRLGYHKEAQECMKQASKL